MTAKIKTREVKKPDRRQDSRRQDDTTKRAVREILKRLPVSPPGETRIRIKINCVITIPTTGRHSRTSIPFPGVDFEIDELILSGMSAAIPSAKRLLPGATVEVENLDFNADWKTERREARDKAKRRC